MKYLFLAGERRIRVHTFSLPVSSTLSEICANADQEAVVSLVAKMGKINFFF
jgi:protein transport protein SEC24